MKSFNPDPRSLIPVPLARRGSALLIVLGMMAFMVISAVAFSAYMRTSRLPSSFLRRASTSRLLAKAALAEAIDEIDGAVGNNPHPGVGTEMPRQGVGLAASDLGGLNADSRHRNHWRGRVYIGSNELYSAEQTVSTLTLEGLAYIPPPLVNEARYYSRRSQAGSWKKLGFDAGRYAFCAIDVSDYFDVNALLANVARSSAAGTRISLAYLFESPDHASQSGSGGTPAQWDSFMKNFTDKGEVPLVSMADWNLAVHELSPCGMLSEFCQFVTGGRTSFYGGIGDTGPAADKVRRQAFVTDSWFPSTVTYSTSAGGTLRRFDLSSQQGQPFTESEIRSDRTLLKLAMDRTGLSNDPACKQLEQSLSGLGFAALYDYLDRDDTPVSLAIPTTERVPMICALMPEMNGGTYEVEATEPNGPPVLDPDPSTAQPGQKFTISYKVKYAIKGIPNAPVGALVTYPFRHQDVPNNNSYEVGGRLSYFLSVDGEDVPLRTNEPSDLLHIGYKPDLTSFQNVDNAVLTVPFRPTGLSTTSFKGDTQGPEGAVQRVSLTPSGIIPSSIPFLEVEYKSKELVYTDDGNGKAVPPRTTINLADGDQATAATCSWQPLAANGTPHGSFSGNNLLTTLNNAGFTKKLKVNLAVWAWVKNTTTGKYVDLVPACGYDDADLNMKGTDSMSRKFSQDYLGWAYPLMRFDTAAGKQLQFAFASANVQKGVLATDAGTQFELTPKSVMVCDPRYNHAPESWFAQSGNITPQTWLQQNESGWQTAPTDNIRRDGDIFMQVSDQEYLQSAFELANLPRLTDFYQVGTKWGPLEFYENPANKNFTEFPTDVKDTANFNLVWRTYDPFPRYLNGGDNFDECGFVNEAPGFRVNPYSDMTNVVLAAFANTPHEWRVASTNEQTMSAAGVPEDALAFNRKYAWNEYSSGAALVWDDLEDLAADFIGGTRTATEADKPGDEPYWEEEFHDLGWYAANKTGEELSKLLLPGLTGNLAMQEHGSFDERVYSTDRKFLFGYWHDCFAVKQQLFLVFVRAEPMMAGGAAGGKIPPQLGARAVALVWRDPAAAADNRTPHRTRVLFYRQFD